MRRRTADETVDRGIIDGAGGAASRSGGRRVGSPAAPYRGGRLTVLLAAFVVLALPGLSLAEPEEAAAVPPPTRILVLDETNAQLTALLSVPGMTTRPTPAQLADARIAEAVALGSRPELERKSGFRKRKLDLFRAERPVEIGEQEMVLRLRVRAKRRETMKVELRF